MCALVIASVIAAAAAAKPPTQKQLVELLKHVDTEMYSPGDYKALVYLEQKRKNEEDRVFQLLVLRRDSNDDLILLFTKPKTEAGVGYLRIGRNLWHYSARIGKWERRTVRDRIAGTSALTADFDKWTLSTDYVPTYEADERLGDHVAHRIKLTAKPDVEVVFARAKIWIDKKAGFPLKFEGISASGRLVQTTYYPRWLEAKSGASKSVVHYPKEIRIFDELDKSSQTLILIQQIELKPLTENVFTKAWVESQSR